MNNTDVTKLDEVQDSLKTIGSLLDEALKLINKFHSIKPSQSIPESESKTMITPE
jgi:hypothetical protein